MTVAGESSRLGAAPWLAAALAALAVAYQIQVTLPVSAAGLRVCAADVLAPILGLFMAASVRAPLAFSSWRVPQMWLWLAALTAWMTTALFVGRFHAGEWIGWALVNKYAGWFVLLANLMLGNLIATADAHGRFGLRETFLKALFVSAWAIAVGSVGVFVFARIGIPGLASGSDAAWRLQGLLVNANAYGYFVAVMIAFQAPYLARRTLLPLHLHRIGLVIGILALILAASRSAWIGAVLALVVLYRCHSLDLRETGRAAVLAVVLAVVLYLVPTLVGPFLDSIKPFVDSIRHVMDSVSAGVGLSAESSAHDFGTPLQQIYLTQERGADIAMRIHVMSEAFSAWLAHPIEGIGLGGFLRQRMAAGDDPLILIHGSGQWLLTETGLVGFGLFVAFFVKIVRALLVPRQIQDEDLFRIGMLAALAVFVGASIGMEAMYQRHLWFLLGWALALPGRPSGTASERGG